MLWEMLTFANIKADLLKEKWLCQAGSRAIGRSERSDKKSERSHQEKEKKKKVAENEVTQVMENPDLTDKQRLFCIYYIRSFNATKAYQKAYGCSYENAMQNGSRMLRNDKVKAEILRLKQERLM